MKPRVTLAFILLAAALGAGYWYGEIKTKPAREAAKEDAKRIFPGKPAERCTEIVLGATGKADVILRKTDGVWRLAAPVQALADEGAMKTLIEQFGSAMKDEIVDEKGDPHKYGLDAPTGVVTLKGLSGGAKAGVLFLGMDSFDGNKVYGKLDSGPQVFLTERSTKTSILNDVNAFRDKHLLSFEPEQVDSVRCSVKGGFSLEHDAQGQWQVRIGTQVEPADNGRVLAWLGGLKNLRGESVAEENAPKAAKYGLGGAPRVSIALKGKPALALIKGRIKDKGPLFYGQLQGQGQVWEIKGPGASALEQEGHALMDLKAFDIKPGLVERFVVWQPGLTLTAQRKDKVWAWDPPYAAKPGEKAFNFDDFVAKVGGAERLGRLPEGAKPARPQMTLAFYGSTVTPIEQIAVGSKQGPGQLAVSASKRLVMIVASNVFDGLPTPDKK